MSATDGQGGPRQPRLYRFDDFELDLDTQQLRSGQEVIRLERRPFNLLVMLVENRDRMVSREELIASLWPDNVIIDFESGLNTLVRKIRSALGDPADHPLYIETVPGKGYRFAAPVARPAASQPAASRSRWLLPAALALAIVLGAVAWLWSHQLAEAPAQLRIAILPFDNLTGDEQLGYIAAGLAEETSASIAAVDLPNLSIIGMASTSSAARSSDSLAATGKTLDADYLVLGSVRLEQLQVRITSRLVRVADGEQIWSATFNRRLTNILGLQRELSVAIAEQIRQQLSPDVVALIDQRQTQNPDAFSLYLKGRHEWSQFRPDSIAGAIDFYRQAVEKDPEYALAWAGIAHALVTSVVTIEADPRAVAPAASEALERALLHGPNLAETQLALASYHFFLEGDRSAAEAGAREAIRLDPNAAMAYMFLGLMLSEGGAHPEASAMMRRARELDPLFPLIFANSSYVALAAGKSEEALELATQAIAINPEFWVGYLHRGNAQLAREDFPGALQSFTEAARLSGHNSALAESSKAFVLATIGRSDQARDILETLLARAAERGVRHDYIAIVFLALGDSDSALTWLEQGLSSGRVPCRDIDRDGKLSSLADDPRFLEAIEACSDIGKSSNAE